MSDFKIQRGVANMADSESYVTIEAGTHYDAPSAASKAFVMVVSTQHESKADFTNGADETLECETVRISYPTGDITDDVRFTRSGTTGGCKVAWQIIEYIGAASGANEFIVRGVGEISAAYTVNPNDSGAIADISNVSDCVPFLTAQASSYSSDVIPPRHMFTLHMINDGDDKVRATRGQSTGGTMYCSYAVVEFTGSNWTVQTVTEHTYSAAGSEETESISSVGDMTYAFLEVQLRTPFETQSDDETGQRVYLKSATQLGYIIQSGATAGQISRVYVISNPSMTVQHFTDTQGTGGSEPETVNETVTEVASLATTSIQGACATGAGVGRRASHVWLIRPTTTTNIELSRVETEYSSTYCFDVVQWPSGASTPPGEIVTHYYNDIAFP